MVTLVMSRNRRTEKKGPAFVIRSKGMKAVLIILAIIGFVMSVAFPYGLGLVAFVAFVAIAGALGVAGYACYGLVRDMFGKAAIFGYNPANAYMTGAKTRKKKSGDPPQEEQKK